jgi:hypothetical protein
LAGAEQAMTAAWPPTLMPVLLSCSIAMTQ